MAVSMKESVREKEKDPEAGSVKTEAPSSSADAGDDLKKPQPEQVGYDKRPM
jgi:hypothetical protein